MGRTLRPYLPGGIFHVAARTIGQQRWFDDYMRDFFVEALANYQQRGDAEIIAFVPMPHHYHILLRQHDDPISRIIQPLNRALALRIQRRRRRAGTIFERRFRLHQCESALHLRRSIVYIHLNPWKAKLVSELQEYRWSSHHAYTTSAATGGNLRLMREVFARSPATELDALCADYNLFIKRRQEILSREIPSRDPAKKQFMPTARFGDDWYARNCVARSPLQARPVMDLRDIALQVLADWEIDLLQLYGPSKARHLTAARHAVIRTCLDHGYCTREIAIFLRVSDSCVSKVATAMYRERWASRVSAA